MEAAAAVDGGGGGATAGQLRGVATAAMEAAAAVATAAADRRAVSICCVSDTHGDHMALAPLPQADILLHAGDFTRFGRESDVAAFEAWGLAQPQPPERCIVVLGNHENPWVQDGKLRHLRALLPSWTLLADELHTAAGLTFFGSHFLPEHGSEAQSVRLPAPGTVDVLVTHNPPRGHLDGGGGGHVALRAAAQLLAPRLHVFGHIHGAAGVEREGSRLLVNAANCGRGNKCVRPPVLVGIPPGSSANVMDHQGLQLEKPLVASREPPPGTQLESEPPQESLHGVVAAAAAAAPEPMCWRFRRSRVCGCTIPCRRSMTQVTIDEVRPGVFIGPVQAAYRWEDLSAMGVTHVVDLSGSSYDRAPQFQYTRIEVADIAGADMEPPLQLALACAVVSGARASRFDNL